MSFQGLGLGVRSVGLLTVSFAFLIAAVGDPVAGDVAAELGFEAPHEGAMPTGWGGAPAETIHPDEQVVHAGQWAVRLEREASSPDSFTSVAKVVRADVQGTLLELRGWLRTQDVESFAGLWLREDGPGGSLQFDNMSTRPVKGTTDWTEYSITLPLAPAARQIVFGALLASPGRVWVDDLQLLVDGRPIDEAPRSERPEHGVDRDHEFDAGSGFTTTHPTPAQVENLVVLGKLWGFLKYHHPRVVRGELHWDYELFRALPAVLAAEGREQRDAALLAWARRIADPEPCEPCAAAPRDVHFAPEIDWIGDRELIGPELGTWLARVYKRRWAGGDGYYAATRRGIGNADFSNEESYPELETPDAGFRLLALFRYWNIIEYWFPYRDQIDGDWETVLAEFVPRVLAAEDSEAYALELMALIARVSDTHANLWNALALRPPRGDCRIPVALRWVEGHAVVSGFVSADAAERTRLQVGDALLELDGEPIDTLLQRWDPWYAASNEASRRRDQTATLTRGACGPAQLLVLRAGERLQLEVERVPEGQLDLWGPASAHDRPGDSFQRLSDEVAYLSLRSARQADLEADLEAARGTRGLVIDIRNYPSEFMVFALGRHLVQEPTPFVCFTGGDVSNPGAFRWGELLELTPVEPRYAGRVAILVDESSQSQAEYTALAFRASPDAAVIGSTTAGADGNVSSIALPGQLNTMISGIGVFHPDRSPTQRVGILPDIEARPTMAGLAAGRDEVLEAALRWILGPEADEAEIQRLARR